MSDPILHYQTPLRPRGLWTVSWVLLLIFGILMCLFGACGVIGFVHDLVIGPNDKLPLLGGSLEVVAQVILLVATLGSGITYLWASRGIRRRSLKAGKTALALVYVNLMLILLLILVNAVGTLPNAILGASELAVIGCFYGFACLPDCILIYFLRRALREKSFEALP